MGFVTQFLCLDLELTIEIVSDTVSIICDLVPVCLHIQLLSLTYQYVLLYVDSSSPIVWCS